MSKSRLPVLACLALLVSVLTAQLVVAEIYKWVDEDGKVHFGDKPLDSAQAEDAEQVELKESYRPTERTAQEEQVYRREQELLRRKTEARQRVEQQAEDEQTAQRREQKAARCAAYAEDIARLTSMEVSGGSRTYYYIEEDGKSVTSQRQREIVEELKAEMQAAGCR